MITQDEKWRIEASKFAFDVGHTIYQISNDLKNVSESLLNISSIILTNIPETEIKKPKSVNTSSYLG